MCIRDRAQPVQHAQPVQPAQPPLVQASQAGTTQLIGPQLPELIDDIITALPRVPATQHADTHIQPAGPPPPAQHAQHVEPQPFTSSSNADIIAAQPHAPTTQPAGPPPPAQHAPVSYTHLTLPTILLV